MIAAPVVAPEYSSTSNLHDIQLMPYSPGERLRFSQHNYMDAIALEATGNM